MDNRKEGSDLGVPAPERAVGLSGSPLRSGPEDGTSPTIPNAGLLILRHAIGLSDSGVAGAQGEFRNHFVTDERTIDFPMCEELVRHRLMIRRRYGFDEVSPSWIYHATEEGKTQARAKAQPQQ